MIAKLTRKDLEEIIEVAWKTGQRPNFSGVDLRDADLNKVNFSDIILRKANLHGVDLFGANLVGADFFGANLMGANLREAELSKINLIKANLVNANLINTDLSEANLAEADLRGADFSRANLHKVDLSKANLTGATLSGADLREACLREANLIDTNFTGANLTEVHFWESVVWNTIFINVDLRTTKGLDAIKHRGSSYIDTLTLTYSQGKIPKSFLLGCGLSDLQIELIKLHNPDLTAEQITNITYKIHGLLVNNPIQYYSCFISYSHKDGDCAEKMYAGLQDRGVRCWFAPEEMKIGDKIRPTIDQSIRIHDKLLLILSEHSINSSWVEKEVETAFEEERKRNQIVLFPVRLDQAVMETNQAWAADIRRTRYIGDFSRWKDHEAYQQAFERLLRDLQAAG